MTTDNRFANLQVKDWRQFGTVELDLTNRLTILTGENGTGKTSLLSLLGGHFGHQTQFVSTPRRKDGKFYFVSVRKMFEQYAPEWETFGDLLYASGDTTQIGTYASNTPEFAVYFQQQQQIPGVMLDSHRVVSSYGKVESVPPRFRPASEIYDEYKTQLRSWWSPNVIRKSPSLLMKESLIAAAIYGEGNSAVTPDPLAAMVWTGFQSVLRELLPGGLEFVKLRVDQAEVLIETTTGTFALESLSGGVGAIFELAWQIYLQSRDSEAFTVCFDEPENHLHPSLQRSLIPQLLRAFPNVSFVIATHSPFVVTSSRDAKVYVLRRDDSGKVNSEILDLHAQAWTVDEVLRDVLGVGSTMPIWAETAFNAIMSDFTHQPLTGEAIAQLSNRLGEAGFRFSVPEVVDSVSAAEDFPRES